MLIPYNTHAPIYHLPIATGGLIAANVLVFLNIMAGHDVPDWIVNGVLVYGSFNPWQWVVSNFIHGSLMHLAGNMFFLWGFGLIVEGKLGWWRFLALYLSIGILECALEQALMYNIHGGSIGASSILFGLLAISVVWAPMNNVDCVLWIGRVFLFTVPVYIFGALYFVMQIVFMGLAVSSGGAAAMVGSELLHLLGAMVALPIGIAMLKLDWVDCEGWDAFTLLERNKPTKSRSKALAAAPVSSNAPTPTEAERSETLAALQQALETGQREGAVRLWRKHAGPRGIEWNLPEELHKKLAPAALAEKEWEAAIQLLQQWIDRGLANHVTARIKLAELYCRVDLRPQKALRLLASIDEAKLPEKHLLHCRKLRVLAEKMIAEGHLELSVDE